MMQCMMNTKGDFVTIVLENKKECDAMVSVIAAALLQKPLNKRSNAFKLAKFIDDELPV